MQRNRNTYRFSPSLTPEKEEISDCRTFQFTVTVPTGNDEIQYPQQVGGTATGRQGAARQEAARQESPCPWEALVLYWGL